MRCFAAKERKDRKEFQPLVAADKRRSNRAEFFFASSCSHTRRTRQPARRKARVTSTSRALFDESLRRQNARLFFGFVACLGQPCQKQPSTKMASLSFGKTKSGLPNTGWLRRQPLMRCRRNNFASASSVALFPRPRIRDITSDRFDLVKTSAMISF